DRFATILPVISRRRVRMYKMAAFLPLLLMAGKLEAATTNYDLTTDWSDTNNPNGVWRLLTGNVLLPHQSSFAGCFNNTPGITGGWAPGNVVGNCIPAFFKATGTGFNNDYFAGDLLVHSVDGNNGSGHGQAFVTWTAPADGTIDYSGSMWYAHDSVRRSNDFLLTLGVNILAQGTIAYNSGFTRSNPDQFSGNGYVVHSGDVIALEIYESPGNGEGSLDGFSLRVTETTADPSPSAPEPGTMILVAAGSLCAVQFKRMTASR
ncbi:MAG TPA: hypothetical protein VKE70_32720, partial [Candidatus Solibacter sp.]|nr:hypothetical protein [Candidatus Solibacter sp.]